MSRVGKQPITIPDKVTVTVAGQKVTVKGPKTSLSREVPDAVSVAVNGGQVLVERRTEDRQSRSLHGLTRSLIQNMVTGVSDGFSRVLEIVGVGYRAEQQRNFLMFSLGFSHPIFYELPEGISAKLDGNTRITLSGADREVLGQAAATIRGFRPPEPYKGKGIRYSDETIRTKVGKAGAA